MQYKAANKAHNEWKRNTKTPWSTEFFSNSKGFLDGGDEGARTHIAHTVAFWRCAYRKILKYPRIPSIFRSTHHTKIVSRGCFAVQSVVSVFGRRNERRQYRRIIKWVPEVRAQIRHSEPMRVHIPSPYPIGTTSESRIRKRPCRSPSWLHIHYIICMTYRQGVFESFCAFCVFLCVKRHCVIDIHPDSCYHKDAAEAGWLLLVVVFDWLPSPYAGSLYYLPLPNIEYLHTRTSGRVFFLPVLC